MAYEDRENGTHAMTCDTPNCAQEMLSPGKDELDEDLALAGWQPVGKDEQGDELYRCPMCNRGRHPAAMALMQMTGGTGELPVEVPCMVTKGDPCHDADGNLVGHYTHDGEPGDTVQVKVQLPEVPAPPNAVELYDEMLEGTDADDDALGRVSAVAPVVDGVAGGGADSGSDVDGAAGDAVLAREPAPVPYHLDTAPGAEDGIVAAPKRPDPNTPEAQAAIAKAPAQPKGPTIDQGAIAETAALFDNMDATDWDPDND